MTKPVSAVAAVVLAACALLVSSGCRWEAGTVANTNTETREYAMPEGVSRLVVTSCAGNVTVTRGSGVIDVTETLRYHRRKPTTSHATLDGTLTVRSDGCRSGASVDFTIRVPERTKVEVTTNAGNVEASDITASVSLKSHAGNVTGRGLAADVVSAEVTAGNVDLTTTSAPTKLVATTNAGNVDLKLPRGVPYAVDAKTTAGNRTISVETDPASTHHITAHTTAGNVTVASS